MPGDTADDDLFEGRLRDALRREVQRSAVHVTAEQLHAAASAPPEPWRPPRWWPVAGLATAAVFLLVALRVMTNLAVPNDLVPQATGPARSSAQDGTAATRAPITLADCRIYPEDARLAFDGWATTHVLGVSGGAAKPGQPVYALVTRGLAEWVGWRSPDAGPIFPAPVGRMGCIFDPSSGTVSLVGVPMDWQPPAMIDGCPSSPQDEYAGYQEIGGPRAWALLPTGPTGWTSGERAIILYRLTPPLAAGETLTAWAVPLRGGDRVDGSVGTASTTPRSGAPGPTPEQGAFSYYVVEQPFSRSGCWVLNVTIDGQLAGSAITLVAAP